jgi:hypothetical protein
MNKKLIWGILVIIAVIAVVSIALTRQYRQGIFRENNINVVDTMTGKEVSIPTPPASPAYTLMSSILSTLDVKNLKPADASFAWFEEDYKKTSYNGYRVVFTTTKKQGDQIQKTWETLHTIDNLDLSTRFENELKKRGFETDKYNYGDATFHGQIGYVSGNIICLVEGRGDENAETVTDPNAIISTTTIICADKKETLTSIIPYSNKELGFGAVFPATSKPEKINTEDVQNGAVLHVDYPSFKLSIFVLNHAFTDSCPVETNQKTINGITFHIHDSSGEFSAVETRAVARSYCVVHGDLQYVITPFISYALHSGGYSLNNPNPGPDKASSFEMFDKAVNDLKFHFI